MDAQTVREIDAAIEEWRRGYELELTKSSVKSYAKGTVQAQAQLRLVDRGVTSPPPTPPRIDLSESEWKTVGIKAEDYAKDYGKLLVDKGATVIDGKEVAWLADREVSERQAIMDIIQKGVEEGRAPGYIESEAGTYPKGSIADQLSEHFEGRKSWASMVARDQTMRIKSEARIEGWKERGVEKVKIYDAAGGVSGISAPQCIRANGQIWSLEDYEAHIKQHPNCSRTAWVYRGDDEPETPDVD